MEPMMIEIIKRLFTLSGVYTDLIINPEMEDQPKIGICNLEPDFVPKDIKQKKGLKLIKVIYRTLWLDFSIRYEIPKVDFVLPLIIHFREEGKIILKKFRRKTFFETYFFGKSKEAPREIKLPGPGTIEDFKGHYMLISNHYFNNDLKLTKMGSIFVSIFSKTRTIVTQSLLKEAVCNFRYLLEIGENNDPNQYAYRFSVETATNDATNRGIFSRKVYTNMFKVVFDKDGSGVKVEYVNPFYYHLS